jgi:hypothetical protein
MSISDLLARVQAATGPDRVLDLLIFAATTPDHTMMLDPGSTDGVRGSSFGPASEFDLMNWEGREDRAAKYHAPPEYTRSVDDALALVERLLPGFWYVLGRGRSRPDEPLYGVALYAGDPDPVRDGHLGEGEHEASAPLAILTALLNWKAAQS